MVAARNRSPRAVAVALAVVMLLPAATLLVPTGAASHPIPSMLLEADKTFYVKDELITLTVTATAGSTGCTGGLAPTITGVQLRQAEATSLGWQTLAFNPIGNDQWRLVIRVNGTAQGASALDGVPLTFEATATSRCLTNEIVSDTETASRTVAPTIDNVPGSGTAQFIFTTLGQYRIDMSGVSGASSVLADLRAIGRTAVEGLPTTATSTTSFPLPATTDTTPVSVTVNDTAGQAGNLVTTLAPSRVSTDLQVFAIADRKVHVRFTNPGPSTDVFGIGIRKPGATTWDIWTSSDPLVQKSVDGLTWNLVLPESFFTPNQVNEVRVWKREGGSDGVPSSLYTVTPSATPNAVSVLNPPTGAIKAIGPLSGGSSSAGASPAVRVALLNATDPTQFWQNDAAGTFSTTPHHVTATRDETTGAWSTNVFDVNGPNGVNAAAIPNGSYILKVELTVSNVVAATQSFPIILDTKPAAGSGLKVEFPALANSVYTVHQGGRIQVYVNFKDEHSTMRNLTFQLRGTTGSTPPRVVALNGGFVERECLVGSCLTTGGFGTDTLAGSANVTFAYAPVGRWQFVGIAYDAAGNPTVHNFGNVQVVPAVQVRRPELRGDSIFMDLLAEFEAAQSLSPSENCVAQDYSCKLTDITIYGRNGGTGNGVVLATLTAPQGVRSDDGSGRLWWNYSLDSGLGTGSLSRTQLIQVRAEARAQIAPGTTDASFAKGETAWIPVTAPTNPGGIIFRYPSADWKVDNTGKMRFNVTFNQTDLPSEAFLEGTITRLDAAATPIPVTRHYGNALSGNVRPRTSFNYTVSVEDIPEGQYAAEFLLYTNESKAANVVLGKTTRYFAVEMQAPVVNLTTVGQPNVFPRGDNWVPRQFILHAYVDPGFANVSSSGFDFKLQRNVRGTGKTVLNNSEEGFVVQVDNPQDLNPLDKDAVVRLNVTLPSSGLNGDVFTLLVGVKSDGMEGLTPPIPQWKNATNVTFPLRLDLDSPSAGVDVLETNSTALSATSQLKIIGFATDAGAGVREVRVRLVNLSSNTTFHWGNSFFNVGGNNDHWATTMPVRMPDTFFVRDVGVLNNSTTGSQHVMYWAVNETTRPRLGSNDQPTGSMYDRVPLDRASRYRVDIQVIDRLGQMSEFSQELGLDPEGPKILTPLSADPGPYQWHGPAKFSVQVSDNWCIHSVSLVARTDTGRDYGPVPMDRPANTGCRQANAASPQVWTVDLKDHPVMTDEPANFTYWVSVMDASGNVTETPVAQRTLKREVVDTQPAIVKFLRLEPPLVGPGSRSRVVAEVFEVGGIESVRVFLHRINHDRTYTQLGEGVMRPTENVGANGTGEYVAETDTDLGITNLTLGDYLWEVRPLDRHWETTCLNPVTNRIECDQEGIILRVVTDAGIFIQDELPAAGTKVVNGTPVFRWSVFDKTITASGITVLAGNSSDTLESVAPTNVTDMPMSGTTRTGVIVEYRPNVTTDTFAVRLQATSQGLTNQSALREFTVDRDAPVVSSNVTETVALGGRNYTVAATRVNVTATDDSPVAITYTVNGGTPQVYTGNVTPVGSDGDWRFEYTATDAAGNAARGSVVLAMDRTGPSINVSKHGDEILLTVTDAGVGVNESSVRVLYAYGNSTTFTPATFQKLTGNSYRAQLTGNSTATGLRYYFEARDLLGNTGTRHSAAAPYVIEPEALPSDLPPTLQITSPAAGASVRQKVELRWVAEDPEGQDVTITIALRTPTGQGRILQTAGPNNRTYTVDLAGAPAGTHTLVVTASDGERTTQESVNFVVERGEVLEVLTPAPVQVEPEGVVPFAIRVNSDKPVANVTYTLVRGDVEVESGELRPTQGGYGANIVPKEAGRYGILVTVAYADGTSEPQREMGSFLVAGGQPTTEPGFPTSLITLVVLALVTIGLAAYAAFVRWGR